jgi:hypothetical protein
MGYFGYIVWFKIGSDFDEDIDDDVKHKSVINLQKYCAAIAAKV